MIRVHPVEYLFYCNYPSFKLWSARYRIFYRV
jgi:hypothetical protein